MCELSVLHCGWDDKTLYWYVKFWWKLLFCIFLSPVKLDFVLTKFCMSICKDVLLMEPCNLHDLTVHAPGGHLYFRVDIILVKGRSKLALSTYFPNMKIDPNYTFCMFFFSVLFFHHVLSKICKNDKNTPFFYFFLWGWSPTQVSPPPGTRLQPERIIQPATIYPVIGVCCSTKQMQMKILLQWQLYVFMLSRSPEHFSFLRYKVLSSQQRHAFPNKCLLNGADTLFCPQMSCLILFLLVWMSLSEGCGRMGERVSRQDISTWCGRIDSCVHNNEFSKSFITYFGQAGNIIY